MMASAVSLKPDHESVARFAGLDFRTFTGAVIERFSEDIDLIVDKEVLGLL